MSSFSLNKTTFTRYTAAIKDNILTNKVDRWNMIYSPIYLSIYSKVFLLKKRKRLRDKF